MIDLTIIHYIKCYLVSLRYVHVPFTYILCQSKWHVYISTNFQNVNKPSTLNSYSTKEILNGALYFPELQKQVRQGAVLKYEVRQSGAVRCGVKI